MRVLLTGANGFIAKNLRSHLNLMEEVEVFEHTRATSNAELDNYVGNADFIFHLAGVNRPVEESEFAEGNTDLTERIVQSLRSSGKKTPLVLASSAQAELDNLYGRSKLAAEQLVLDWNKESGARISIYRLPGVFGKWCRPNYNSVVATFCYNLTHDLPLQVSDPAHRLTLAYIDDVVDDFAAQLHEQTSQREEAYCEVSRTFSLTLGELRDRLKALHAVRSTLVVPDTGDLLNKFLYATYISYLETDEFSYDLAKSVDSRGWLAEFVKSQHFGQIFISKTKPGISRGNHWHKTKIEKFLVVEGQAEITFRNKIDAQDVISYRVDGDQARVLDIPVGYVHAITNVGTTDLLTIFWASEILDKDHPDTFFEAVTEQP